MKSITDCLTQDDLARIQQDQRLKRQWVAQWRDQKSLSANLSLPLTWPEVLAYLKRRDQLRTLARQRWWLHHSGPFVWRCGMRYLRRGQ
ncbi:MAG: hypothetical protein IPO08_23730 [Xanthomonadales bacterium]|nr:hypothetical protein [Xanthomonadales bacterium]